MDYDEKKHKFERLYRKEVDLIFRYAILRVSNREEAMDIVQDTFASFWRAMNGERPIEYPKAMIFAIARNKIIDWYRRKKTVSIEDISDTDNEDSAFEIPDDEAYEEIKKTSEISLILESLNRLSPQHREIVYLRFVEGLSPAEIGSILSITANTASVRINRSLKELREILNINQDN